MKQLRSLLGKQTAQEAKANADAVESSQDSYQNEATSG